MPAKSTALLPPTLCLRKAVEQARYALSCKAGNAYFIGNNSFVGNREMCILSVKYDQNFFRRPAEAQARVWRSKPPLLTVYSQ